MDVSNPHVDKRGPKGDEGPRGPAGPMAKKYTIDLPSSIKVSKYDANHSWFYTTVTVSPGVTKNASDFDTFALDFVLDDDPNKWTFTYLVNMIDRKWYAFCPYPDYVMRATPFMGTMNFYKIRGNIKLTRFEMFKLLV